MSSSAVDTDVLIVGAGPVGLLLANECARHGLRWRIVERRARQSQHSKALAIFPRTLEILDMAGLVGPFLEAANRVTSLAVVTPKRRLARVPFTPRNTPYPFIAMVPQDVTERLLADALVQYKRGLVEYQTAFVSAQQREDAVAVTLDRNGKQETLTARFVVGCDGAHSAVRQGLGLAFAGAAYHERFMLADIETRAAQVAGELLLCPNRRGPLAIFPISATRLRIVAMIDEPEGEAPTLELVRRLLAKRAAGAIEAGKLHWSSYFLIHHRRVSQLRVGRILLAGDAAHIHSPFGGQGMNTGLHDAWNLAWKLDLCLRGHASDALLDSYTAERIPVIKGVLGTTHLLTRAMGTPSRFAELLRDMLIPMLSRFPPFRHALVERLSGLGITYRGSPVVEGAGERHFDDSMRGGTGIGHRFLLLMGQPAHASLIAAAQQLVAAHTDVVELRMTPRPGVTLVRPDGYIAFRSRTVSAAVLASASALLERQAGPSTAGTMSSTAPAARTSASLPSPMALT